MQPSNNFETVHNKFLELENCNVEVKRQKIKITSWNINIVSKQIKSTTAQFSVVNCLSISDFILTLLKDRLPS